MRRGQRKTGWDQRPRHGPLSIDIVALLRRALRQGDYAVAEHLLQALEEIDKAASGTRARECRSRDLDVAYLEIARTVSPAPLGRARRSDVTSPLENGQEK